VVEAVHVARRAGIKVKMITGDYPKTAEHIARRLGLMQAGERSLEGQELASLDDEALQARVKATPVFARIRPHDKLRIVKALQANGEITAMIGDGVNDAPALQRAKSVWWSGHRRGQRNSRPDLSTTARTSAD
jgi:magnesium-transporting ATPase (P-type)